MRPFERTGVGMSVEDEVGPVLGDRRRESLGTEVRVDARRLPFERVDDRRVVEENDPHVAVHDLLQATRERLRLGAGLRVDAAEQRLPEVRQRRAGEAPHEALRADDSELESVHLAARALAIENPHARVAEHFRELGGPLGVMVVIPEDGEDRHVQTATGRRDHSHLFGLPLVVRSPARRTASASPSSSAKARSTRSRLASEAWMSAAAATRSMAPHVARSDKPETTRRCPNRRSRSCSTR